MNLLKRAWNSPTVLAIAGVTSLWVAYHSAFQDVEADIQAHECRSSFGRAVMGLDEYNASFITLTDRFGQALYEGSRMYALKERRAIVDEFCAKGKTPEMRMEKVVGSWPPNYYCEGLNGQKAAVFPVSPDQVRVIRSYPATKPIEIIPGKLMNGAWYAQRHCMGVQ